MKHVKEFGKVNEEWTGRNVINDIGSLISTHEPGCSPNNPKGKLLKVVNDLENFRDNGEPSLESIIIRLRGLADDFSGTRN